MLPKTQADLIASLGLQPTQQNPFAYTPRQPQSTIEPLPFGYRMPSKNPTIRKLQGLGDFAKSLFAVETPLDAVLSGVAPLKTSKVLGLLNPGTTVSNKVAKNIFNIEKELKDIADLDKRNLKLENYYDTDKISDEIFDMQIEKNSLLRDKIESKLLNKVEKKLDKIISNRTIKELDPRAVGRLGISDLLAVNNTNANKNIIKNIGANLDSPGPNFMGIPYGVNKLSPKNIESIEYAINTQKPKFTTEGKTLMNPLEAREVAINIPTTFNIGTEKKPFFVSPKKLADKLDKSGAGEDFFKLRTNEKNYLQDLEASIKREGYKPNPIQIQIQPTGNATIFEGNHRLYRALIKGDEEVPVTFMYTSGAERLDVPFGIKKLDTFLAKNKKGYKTKQEYDKYIQKVNESYNK